MANILLLKKDTHCYRIPFLENFGIKAVITTRAYNMIFEDDDGASDRFKAYKDIKMNWSDMVCSSQVHGDGVFVVTVAHKGRGSLKRKTAIEATDALVTNNRRLPLGVLTADCLPILILGPHKTVIAMIHAGWRGVKDGIISKTIRLMTDRFNVQASHLLAVMGPSIRCCCYEVGREFCDYFPDFVIQRGQRTYFDLQAAAISQLTACGIGRNMVYDSFICTSCQNAEFFSYRREGLGAGRTMFAVEMR
ncbi:MAG: peptidoglycan editing factor PgeF [Candidatus Omnitrophota bacterium]